MHPPSHLTNSNNSSSSHRSRSRSPHPSLHHSSSSSSNLSNKNSFSPPSSSSSRKRNSPIIKSTQSDNFKTSSHSSSLPSVSIPPNFSGFDPLTLSMFERRLPAAYASLFGVPPSANNFLLQNFDPTTFRSNGSSNIYPNLDSSSAMAAALIQREHFLNSLRLSQQEQNFERERAAVLAANKTSKVNGIKIEQTSPKVSEESVRISPKVITSPGSHSSASSSSQSSLSKKSPHVKRVKQSSSPSSATLSNENQEITLKQESIVDSTPTISITT